MSTKNPKRHVYLAACQVLYLTPEGMAARSFNTLRMKETLGITRKDLAYMQQAVHGRFYAESGIENAKVLDVVIMSTNHLGYMTEREFNDGMTSMEDPSKNISNETTSEASVANLNQAPEPTQEVSNDESRHEDPASSGSDDQSTSE